MMGRLKPAIGDRWCRHVVVAVSSQHGVECKSRSIALDALLQSAPL